MGAVLASRVRAHAEGGPPLSEVISPDALERLFQHYRSGLSSELRGVMRTVHTALSEGCDSRADVLTPELIDDAIAAWEP